MPSPVQGAGIGLRSEHLQPLLSELPAIPWLEVLADNWLMAAGIMPRLLDKVAEHYPLCLHSVAMNLGGMQPIDRHYLQQLKQLAQRIDARWISDHCCFSSGAGFHSHNLLPLPYTYEAARHIAERIDQVQDYLGQQILIENVSAYLSAKDPDLQEGEFIALVAEEADCRLLLDINNFYVNQFNLGQDAWQQILQLPVRRIAEIHLGGFEDKGDYLLDGHNRPVAEAVWQLYQRALEHLGPVPTQIEWDQELPPLTTLIEHQRRAQQMIDNHQVTEPTSSEDCDE